MSRMDRIFAGTKIREEPDVKVLMTKRKSSEHEGEIVSALNALIKRFDALEADVKEIKDILTYAEKRHIRH